MSKAGRKFVDLTESEVRQIVQDIFNPKKISNIHFHKRDDEISCNIYTEWVSKDDNGKEEVTTCKDEITLSNPFDNGEYAIHADFSIRKDDYIKLKQFCFANGIYGTSINWMFNNPYTAKKECKTCKNWQSDCPREDETCPCMKLGGLYTDSEFFCTRYEQT